MPSATRNDSAAVPTEEELVRTHLPLVHYAVAEIASRVPRHVSRDDLTSAGMAGLAQAARSYDPERAISFPRFAATRIRGAILDELRSRDWASRSVRAKARQVTAAADRLTATLGRAPTDGELAAHLGVNRAELDSLNRDVQRSVVLNLEDLGPAGSSEDAVLASDATPDAQLLERERQAYMVAAVANLPERLRRVVLGYFFEELPMHVLAEELGVTDSRISQMRAEALGLLKVAIDAQLENSIAEAPEPATATRLKPENGRAARRRAAYLQAVASHHDFRTRLTPEAASLASLASA